MPYKYENGKWTYVANNPSENKGSSSPSVTSPPAPIKPNTMPPWDDKKTTNTKPKADKEYIDYEETILTGSGALELPIVNLKAKSTIKVEGVGKYLSGLYFVDKVVHTFDGNGYTQSFEVSKNGFGETLKPAEVPKENVNNNNNNSNNNKTNNGDDYVLVNKWGTVTPKIGLNVRTGNSTNHKILGAMTKGTRVFCIGKKGGWYDHKYKNQTAWSHGGYIKLDD